MRWSAAAFCLLALLSVTVPRGTAAEEKTDQVLADAIDRATGGDPQTMTQACTTLRASPRRAAPRRASRHPALPRPAASHRLAFPRAETRLDQPTCASTKPTVGAVPRPQLLHWGLQHTNLEELHAKAEHIRQHGGGEGDVEGSAAGRGPAVLSAAGNVGEASAVPGLPSPDGTAAPKRASPMTPERRAELDELGRIMMPDMVAEMRKMLAVAEDGARPRAEP